jgi:DNA-binding Xre family transcriptional regulator
MVATAIERANLYQKAEKHLAQLESLHVIDQAVTAVLDIKVVNKIILDQICKELEADAVDILILNTPTNTLEITGAIGFFDNQIGKIQVPLTTSIAGKVLWKTRIT